MLFTNIYGAATRVVFTKLSEAKRTGARDGEVYLRGFRLITAVMAPLFLGIAVLSGPVIRILYGPKWFGASLPLSLIMIGSFIGLCCSMNWEMFVMHDEMKLQTKLELTRSASNVFVRTIAAQINLAAVAASSIIDAVVSVLLYQKHMPRLARIDSFVFYRAYIELFALSTVAVAPSAALIDVRRLGVDNLYFTHHRGRSIRRDPLVRSAYQITPPPCVRRLRQCCALSDSASLTCFHACLRCSVSLRCVEWLYPIEPGQRHRLRPVPWEWLVTRRCCQSQANRPPHDAARSLSAFA